MGLGDKVKRTLKDWVEEIKDVLTYPVDRGVAWAIERFMDKFEPDVIAAAQPTLKLILDNPGIPQELKDSISQLTGKKSAVQFAVFLPYLLGILIGGIVGSLTPGFRLGAQQVDKVVRSALLFPPDAVHAFFLGELPESELHEVLAKSGFSDNDFKRLIAINRIFPVPTQFRDALLREIISEGDHDGLMAKLGFSPEDISLIKKLYELIPTPTDLVRMAVREVFSPEVVERFGQMEDFPPDFAKWAKKVGVTEPWAKNYWAAHWDLPSARQGFEMLHRAVITYEDLQLLLRALDVMPFWRDKLIEIAYDPYTRVDVRRMHKLGILSRDQVKRAYLDLGYDEEKAENMTKFTEEYNKDPEQPEKTISDERKERQRDLTTAQVMDGFRKGLFTEDEARSILTTLGYDPEEVDFYVSLETYRREQAKKESFISNFKALFVTGIIDMPEASEQLELVGLSAAEIEQLLEVWQLERIRRIERPSRAELDRFLRAGIIDEAIYTEEMRHLGYSDRYITWYLQALKPS